jgi:hypothetical protein
MTPRKMVRPRNVACKTSTSREQQESYDSKKKYNKYEDKLFKGLDNLDEGIEMIAQILRHRRSRRQLLLSVLVIGALIMIRTHIVRMQRRNPRRIIHFLNPDDGEEGSSFLRSKNKSPPLPEVCFVTSSYAKDSSHMDNLVRVVNGSPYLRFFIFTNLNDDEWKTPGWEKIVTNLTYRRKITHSRYGKFLGWKYPQIQECRAVIYMDSCIRPTQRQQLWRDVAEKLESSDVGLMQDLNPKNRSGIFGEFLAIQRSEKDLSHNIVNSLKWMASQPDFDENIPIYWNEQFGYNPKSEVFQELSQAFWDRYSEEADSWRDQPLWAFMLHRYKVEPISWPEDETMWGRSRDDYGHNAHEYYSEIDVLADWLYSPKTEPPMSVLGMAKEDETFF